MEFKMTIDAEKYHIKGDINHASIYERIDQLSDNDGFEIGLNNIFLEGIHLKWGQYKSKGIKTYSVSPEKETVVAHFCLRGACVSEPKNSLNLQRGECMLFKEEKDEYLFQMDVDNGIGEFFEVSFCPDLYLSKYTENHITDEILKGKELYTKIAKDPLMGHIIADMYKRKDNYAGKLKQLYLESKVSELLLIQMGCLGKWDHDFQRIKLHKRDIDAIHHVKDIISMDFGHTTIANLAQSAGINQTKLKAGFKALFGQTIFDFLTSQRMKAAMSLLITTDAPISEIANRIGYNYPQHFISAFKKTFGRTPGYFRK